MLGGAEKTRLQGFVGVSDHCCITAEADRNEVLNGVSLDRKIVIMLFV